MKNRGRKLTDISLSSPQRRFKMIRKFLASLLATLFLVGAIGTIATLSGCNTMEGAGKDIEQGGRAIKDEAREQRRY